MPPIFKALVSIATWVLFIKGWVATLVGAYAIITALSETMMGTTLVGGVAACGAGAASFILAAVAAKLRQMLE